MEEARLHRVFQRDFLILGHRGVPTEAPENTLTSFRRAREQGAHGIELDVRLCASGELVVIHDARLNRTTTGRGFVKSKTLAQLRLLRIRNHRADEATFEHIPTLEEVFEEFGGDFFINIEIKGYPRKNEGVEGKVAELVRRYAAEDRVIVSSFNPVPLRRLRRQFPGIATAFLVDRAFFIRRSEKAIRRLAGVDAIHLEAGLATPELLQRLHDLGLACLLWGEISPEKLAELRRYPLNGMITDHPAIIRKILEREAR